MDAQDGRMHFMYVTDVEAAFPILPLTPWLWWFMLFCVVLPKGSRTKLCMHTHGDFGARGMPGCFYVFYVKVVIPMARSELIITLPMVIYVDDNGLCGPTAQQTNEEAANLKKWAPLITGVDFKEIKDQPATRTHDEMAGRTAPATPARSVGRRSTARPRRARIVPVADDAEPSPAPAVLPAAPGPSAVPVAGSAAAADDLSDIIPFHERPPQRRPPPTQRTVA